MRLILLITTWVCLAVELDAQVMIIPDVPDLQQPIDPWWGNLPDNACAPVSAANICVYWDDIIHHSNAVDLNSGLVADSVPSFLCYFMGTHGLGDPTRANPAIYGVTPGTITMDIDTGFVLTGMSDNCDISTAVLSRTDFDTTDVGSLQPVTLTVYDGSGNSSTCLVTITVLDTLAVSVDAEKIIDENFGFILNPNPSDGHIHIASLSLVRDCILEIYDISGVLLLKGSLPEGKQAVDISDFSQGVYVLKIRDEKGREFRAKIIIR